MRDDLQRARNDGIFLASGLHLPVLVLPSDQVIYPVYSAQQFRDWLSTFTDVFNKLKARARHCLLWPVVEMPFLKIIMPASSLVPMIVRVQWIYVSTWVY